MNCQDHLYRNADPKTVARRWFFQQCGVGLGAMALGQLLRRGGLRRARPRRVDPLAPKAPHFAPKAKRVIFLFMAGAPEPPRAVRQQAAAREVRRHAAAGRAAQGLPGGVHQPELEAARPEVQVRQARPVRAPSCPSCCRTWPRSSTTSRSSSRWSTDAFNHAPAQILMNTGSQQFGRPSLGLVGDVRPGQRVAGPARLRRLQHRARRARAAATRTGAAASCRPSTRASRSAAAATRSSTSRTRRGVDDELQRDSLDAVRALNQMRLDDVGDPEIATRINSFEMAFRMQIERAGGDGHRPASRSTCSRCTAPSRASRRSPTTACSPAGWSSAACGSCEIFHEAWDQHGNLVNDLKKNCKDTDQACAALVKDLKQRGLLDDTLVIWGGEFGRTPMVQGGNDGRDHHPNAFTMWLAGGGVKPGITLGETDDLGFNVVEGQGPRPRPARHDPAPPRLRPHAS